MLTTGAVRLTVAALSPFTVSEAAPPSTSVKLWPTALNGDAALAPTAATVFVPLRSTVPAERRSIAVSSPYRSR